MPHMKLDFFNIDTDIQEYPFINMTTQHLTEKQLNLVNKGPSYIPPFQRKSESTAIAMIKASMHSFKCQLHRMVTKDNIEVKKTSIYDAQWRYIPPPRRKIPCISFPIDQIDNEVQRLEQQLIKIAQDNIKINNKNQKNIDEAKTINELKKLPIIIMPSDKTKKLIALENDKYEELLEEHMSNYEVINTRRLPSTEQIIFNKSLENIAKKYEEPLKSLIQSTKCNEPTPSIMYCVPKDHKEILKGRPIVNATDTPSTALCKLLGDIMKPLLDHIPSHIKDSSDFIRNIKKHKWDEKDQFGSLDVTNLYGSIPIEGNDNVIDIVSQFYHDNKNLIETKELHTEDFKSLIKLSISSDIIVINNKIHKQKSGLAMGNNLSPLLAIIYMHYIEKKIQDQANSKIFVWLRYIDDIFFITSMTHLDILRLANTINPNIQFTLETPVNNSIPFLDILLTRKEEKIDTCLYIKPYHSNHILPWSSNTTTRQKIGVIKTEKLRAERISSDLIQKQISLGMIKSKLLKNGYPYRIIKKYLYNEQITDNTNYKKKDKNKIDSVIKLPYINEKSSQKMQYLIRKSTLNANPRIIFKTPPPLSICLQKQQNKICRTGCLCDNRNICNKKNIIYKITCTICNAFYIGETSRTIRTRIKEHMKQKESEIFKHFKSNHKEKLDINRIKWEIIGSGYISASHRKEHEKILIKQKNPEINIVHISDIRERTN